MLFGVRVLILQNLRNLLIILPKNLQQNIDIESLLDIPRKPLLCHQLSYDQIRLCILWQKQNILHIVQIFFNQAFLEEFEL